jgi:hypothetical protein
VEENVAGEPERPGQVGRPDVGSLLRALGEGVV